eukprot:356923-Chlamydomonas_euryale.AAC.5
MFGTMIGTTDAASVLSVLQGNGAPEIVSVILDAESLLNDASALTMCVPRVWGHMLGMLGDTLCVGPHLRAWGNSPTLWGVARPLEGMDQQLKGWGPHLGDVPLVMF